MTAVSADDRSDLDEVEDVALLVALSESFSFEPLRLAEVVPLRRRRRRHRLLRVRLPRLRLRLRLRLPRLHLPRLHLPRLRMPRRRLRSRRYAVQPIIIEGPRRVPIEVLNLSRSSSE